MRWWRRRLEKERTRKKKRSRRKFGVILTIGTSVENVDAIKKQQGVGETGVEPSSMDLSYGEVSNVAIVEDKAEEELGKMIACILDSSSKV